MKDDNVKGPTTAFCTFTPFKSGFARFWNWFVLKAAPVATREIREQRFLHYMCFVRVSPRHLKRAGIRHRGRLGSGALAFLSAYNGTAEGYFRGFSANLSTDMNRLWGGCVDWKGADDYDALEKFVVNHRRPAQFHFNAYPDETVNLRTALRLRADLDDLVALAHREPERFLEEYRRVARVAWGGPPGGGTPE